MAEFLDVVHARVRDGAEQEMLSRRPVLEAGVKQKLPGLLDITLIRLEDGTYLDVLRWESREASDAAVPKFADVPEAVEIHEFLPDGLAHYRGEVAFTNGDRPRAEMGWFYDVPHSRVREGLEDDMLHRWPELSTAVRRQLPGLRDMTLVRLDDGTYIDMLRWESREAADAGAAKFGEIPEAGEIHGFAEETLAHHRGEVAVA